MGISVAVRSQALGRSCLCLRFCFNHRASLLVAPIEFGILASAGKGGVLVNVLSLLRLMKSIYVLLLYIGPCRPASIIPNLDSH